MTTFSSKKDLITNIANTIGDVVTQVTGGGGRGTGVRKPGAGDSLFRRSAHKAVYICPGTGSVKLLIKSSILYSTDLSKFLVGYSEK